MKNNTLKAEHGQPDKPLKIGQIEIPCYVLENGQRVLVSRGLSHALSAGDTSSSKLSGQRFQRIIQHKDFELYIDDDLKANLLNPIHFTIKGRKAFGYEAKCLPRLCNALLKTKDGGVITYNHTYHEVVIASDIIIRGFAEVGIDALVDEATGYQEVRQKDALQKILDAYLTKESSVWAKRFPDDFYKEIFRLKGWPYNPMSVKRPSYVGRYTQDIVYNRLAPEILKELEKKNPQDDKDRKNIHIINF